MQTNTSKCIGSEFGSKSSNIPVEGSQTLKIATPPKARSENKVIPTEGGDAFVDLVHTSREIRVVRFEAQRDLAAHTLSEVIEGSETCTGIAPNERAG